MHSHVHNHSQNRLNDNHGNEEILNIPISTKNHEKQQQTVTSTTSSTPTTTSCTTTNNETLAHCKYLNLLKLSLTPLQKSALSKGKKYSYYNHGTNLIQIIPQIEQTIKSIPNANKDQVRFAFYKAIKNNLYCKKVNTNLIQEHSTGFSGHAYLN